MSLISMPMSPELNRQLPHLEPFFAEAGLEEDKERETFLKLCHAAEGYPTHAEILAENQRLAHTYGNQLALHPLGHSTGYPDGRRIEAAMISCGQGRHPKEDAIASLEAPQHSTELAAVRAAGAQKRLHLRHPRILSRMGWDGIVISDHGDPYGMELQSWARKRKPTVRDFIRQGVRGTARAQLSCSYPISTFPGSYEAQASLRMYRTFQPLAVGVLHNSLPAAYNVVSPDFPVQVSDAELVDPMVHVYEALGMPVNYCTAEGGVFPLLTFGMYAMPKQLSPRYSMVVDHLPPGTIYYNPEVSQLFYPELDVTPSGRTLAQAFVERAESIARRIRPLETVLTQTDLERHGLDRDPLAVRLRDTVAHWCEEIDELVATAYNIPSKLPKDLVDKPLTITEFFQTNASLEVNSLMTVANAGRLALMTGHDALGWQLLKSADDAILPELGPVEMAPLDLIVCAQGLASLIAMRRVAQAKGLA
jgi:hypothetical protein